jgi:hypothetical protein
LNEAFAGHPWVAEVRRVELTPAKEIRVDLLYREPVLSVRLPGACRAVDREGALLPVVAAQAGLPRLTGPVGAPTGGPGHPWGDANVEAAARTVALLGPHRDQLPLADCSVTAGPGGIVLRGPRWRIVWGSPPGSEKVGEPSAEAKVRWLLRQADLAGHEYDLRRLRPVGQAARLSYGASQPPSCRNSDHDSNSPQRCRSHASGANPLSASAESRPRTRGSARSNT